MATAAPKAPTITDQQVHDFVQTNFPSYVFALSDPELFGLFKQAINVDDPTTMSISGDQLTSKLEATNWWKTHGPHLRQYIAGQQTDPGDIDEQVRAKDADVHVMANQLGLADNQLNIDDMARKAIMYNWDDNELKEQLASLVKFNAAAPNTSNIGTVDNSIAQLRANAAGYLVHFDDQTFFNWARDIAAGHHSVDDYTPMMIDHAKGQFPTLASIIDQGITPKQYLQPIQQRVATELEISPDGVDFNDPKFAKIISYNDPKTGAPRPMNGSEASSYARSMDQWKDTKRGQQIAADATEGILNIFQGRSGGTPSSLNASFGA